MDPLLSGGFEILKEADGYLNFDNDPDHAVVLSEKISETEDRRKLLIFLKNKNGKVIRVFENDSIVFGTGEGGFCCPDPFGGIKIDNGKLSVIHMSGDCWRTSTALNFQFNAKLNELYFAELIITEFYACKNTKGIEDIEYTVANPELRRIKFSDYTGEADLIYRNNNSQ
jgi:hypothetical protein